MISRRKIVNVILPFYGINETTWGACILADQLSLMGCSVNMYSFGRLPQSVHVHYTWDSKVGVIKRGDRLKCDLTFVLGSPGKSRHFICGPAIGFDMGEGEEWLDFREFYEKVYYPSNCVKPFVSFGSYTDKFPWIGFSRGISDPLYRFVDEGKVNVLFWVDKCFLEKKGKPFFRILQSAFGIREDVGFTVSVVDSFDYSSANRLLNFVDKKFHNSVVFDFGTSYFRKLELITQHDLSVVLTSKPKFMHDFWYSMHMQVPTICPRTCLIDEDDVCQGVYWLESNEVYNGNYTLYPRMSNLESVLFEMLGNKTLIMDMWGKCSTMVEKRLWSFLKAIKACLPWKIEEI